MQIWNLQPEVETWVDVALKEMRRMRGPIVAFHVQGGGGDENLLFDVRPFSSVTSTSSHSDTAVRVPRNRHDEHVLLDVRPLYISVPNTLRTCQSFP